MQLKENARYFDTQIEVLQSRIDVLDGEINRLNKALKWLLVTGAIIITMLLLSMPLISHAQSKPLDDGSNYKYLNKTPIKLKPGSYFEKLRVSANADTIFIQKGQLVWLNDSTALIRPKNYKIKEGDLVNNDWINDFPVNCEVFGWRFKQVGNNLLKCVRVGNIICK